MNKEQVRTLIQWMDARHNTELNSIRVGSNQVSRRGSVTYYHYAGDMNMSVSAYEGAGSFRGIVNSGIIITILHEFAHAILMKEGYIHHGHGRRWVNKFSQLILDDYKELVRVYNIIACDNLSECFGYMLFSMEERNYDYDQGTALMQLAIEQGRVDYIEEAQRLI